jgi:hypothetical protein
MVAKSAESQLFLYGCCVAMLGGSGPLAANSARLWISKCSWLRMLLLLLLRRPLLS